MIAEQKKNKKAQRLIRRVKKAALKLKKLLKKRGFSNYKTAIQFALKLFKIRIRLKWIWFVQWW